MFDARENIILYTAMAALLTAAPGYAETGRMLEEVIVTAEKRSENVQIVPISIAVVSAEELSALNLFDFVETAQLTPGISLNRGLQAAAIRLRGVGPAYFALGQPQSVTVFVDQVAQSQVGAVFTTMVDIERLELLRGPQGTLYGQNAPGGAYNITTRAPNFDGYHGYIEGSYSQWDNTGEGRVDTRGAVNIPLIEDTLALRLAGVYSDSDGDIKMENPAASHSATGGQDVQAWRSRMLWQVDERMDINWTMNYQDITQYQEPFNFDGQVPGTGGDNATPAIYNTFNDRKNYGDFRSQVTGDIKDTSVHLRWGDEDAQIDGIANYQSYDSQSDDNREPYPGGLGLFKIGLDTDLTTFELRYSGESERVSYLTGLYYLYSKAVSDTTVTLTGIEVTQDAKGTTESYAAYVNGTIHLAPQWDLSLGARYDYNESTLDSNVGFLEYAGAIDDSLDFDHVSWSIKLQYFIQDNLNAYLAIDNAYKQGGFNTLTSAVLPFGSTFPVQVAAAEDVVPIEEETSTAYEIGLKGTILDDTLRFAVDIFYQEFHDHQLTQPNNVAALAPLEGLFEGSIVNADEVATKGIEFELTYLLGEYWDIDFSGAYFDATIEDWSNRFCEGGEEQSITQLYCPKGGGDPLNSLPQWNTNLQVGYQRPLSGAWEFYSRLNWTWNSEANYTVNTDEFSTDKNLFGLNVGFRESDLGLDIRLWGKNLTNEDFNIDPAVKANGAVGQPAAWEGLYWPGREYGVTVSYNF
ncbi:Pesticin receptor [Halioglobus japonicus]|nr:Pesticin receptor [Halioglobus japonicus]